MKNIVKVAVITALFMSQVISPNYFGACWNSIKASFNRDEQYMRADIQNQQARTDANIALAGHQAQAAMLKHPTSNLSTPESLQRDWNYFKFCKHNTWTPEQRMRYYANQISTIPASYLIYAALRSEAGHNPAVAAGLLTFAQLQALLHRN